MIALPEMNDSEFIAEVWALYAIGVIILLLRFATRIKTVGIKGFQGDDYFSVLTLLFYTLDATTVHIIFFEGTNVEASVIQQTQTLTQAEIQRFVFGSKLQITAWYSYTALIWSMKATMIFFFFRLTEGLWQHRFVKWIGAVCAVTHVVVVLTITFGCFPTQKNWQVVPDPGQQCTLKLQNFLVTVVLNVITDALILAVPIPLLWTLRVPLRRKLVISLLLCSGLFVIAAAIIRVVLTLDSNPSATNINRWGVRETIVGIVTINAPILRPMFTRRFWSRTAWKNTTVEYGESRNLDGKMASSVPRMGKAYELSGNSKGSEEDAAKGGVWTVDPMSDSEVDLERGGQMSKKQKRVSGSTIGSFRSAAGGSEEYIMQGTTRSGRSTPLEVTVQTEFSVQTENMDGVIEEEEQREEEWQKEELGTSPSKAGKRGLL